MPIVIRAGGKEYSFSSFDGYIATPQGPEHKVLQVAGDNTDPINDSGDNAPVSPLKNKPALPPMKDAPPQSAQPAPGDDSGKPSVPKPEDDPDYPNATQDPMNDEYVGGSKVDPTPLPNPEGGALAPNPDNATNNPKGGINQNADSFDDDSAKPDINQLNWYMGKLGLTSELHTDPKTGFAKWPLSFKKVERDFKRTNKTVTPNVVPNQKIKNQGDDSEKLGDLDKPYQTSLPKSSNPS